MKCQPLLCGRTFGLLASLAILPTVSAQTATWAGPDTGLWHTGANWTPASVPGATSDVVIDGETATARAVDLNSGASVNQITVSAGDVLRVNGNTPLQTSAAGYTINGLLELTGGGDSRLSIPVADTVLQGTGEVRLAPGTRFNGGGSLLVRGRIAGAGAIGWNELRIVNESAGRISASIASEVLNLDPRNAAPNGLANQGRMEATAGGILQFSGFGGGNFDNAGGTVTALEGSEIRFINDASLSGGTLTTQGTGVLRILNGNNAYWTDVVTSGEAVVDNNASLRIAADINNSGRIRVAAAGNATELRLNGPAVLRGGGRVALDGSNARIIGVHLLALENQTLSGLGNAGFNEAHITVAAGSAIEADRDQQALTLDPANAGASPGFINEGQLRAKDGGRLVFSGFGGGWFENAGGTVTAAENSEVQFVNNAGLANGTLTTTGSGRLRIVDSHNVYWTDVLHSGQTVVNNNAFLRSSGSIANTGAITLAAAGNATRLHLNAPTTLTGAGRLVMSGSQNAHVAGLHVLTNAGGHVIEGQGNIGVNEVVVINNSDGTIQANVSGASLVADPRNRDGENLPGFVNRGTLQARDAGVLHLSGFGSGWFDNTNGVIRALDGSEVQMASNVSIVSGTLTSEGTGLIRVVGSENAYWSDLTHAGRTVVENNSFLRSAGSITNTGGITLTAAGNATRLQLNAPTTLTGAGRLVMSGSQNAHVGGSHVLTNAGGHIIEGQGNIGVNETVVVNTGGCLIQANVSGALLVLDPRNRDGENLPGFINRGTLQARDGGVLHLSGFGAGWFDNTNGVIRALDGSEVQMASNVSIASGTLTSEGTGLFRVVGSNSAYWSDLTHAGRTVVDNNSYLRSAGSITNTGGITLTAAANATRLQLNAPTTLTGAGRLVMSGSQNAHVGGPHMLTNAGGHMIEGQGNIGVNETVVVNSAGGIIQANVSGALLVLDPRNRDAEELPGFINRGTLQAKDGGVLHLSGFGNGWFDNTGGVIRALDGSEVQMASNVSIANGALAGEGSGLFHVVGSNSAYWTTLTHSGRTAVSNNAFLRTTGAITNGGVITLEASANATRIQLQANTILSGGGKLIMGGDERSNSQVGGAFLLTNDGHIIEGHGNIGVNESAFFNTATGLVHANVPARGLTIDPRNNALVTNRGILRASAGGDLYLSGFGGGGFDNFNGIVEALDGSRVLFVNNPSFSGGVLRTAGTGAMVLPESHALTFTANTTNTGLFTALNNSATNVAGRLTNSGVMRFTGAANLASLTLQDNTTFDGGGVIELSGNARINGSAVLIVEDQTIRGTGNIGWNEASLSVGESGVVIADVPGGTLNFDPTPIFGFTNEGTLRAENGGILNLSSFGGGEIFVGNTGRVEALEGGRVQFDNNTILINRSGGTLTGGTWLVKGQTAATSLQLPGGNITTNAASIELDGSQAQFAQISGLTTNNGSLALKSGASLAPGAGFTNSGVLEIGAGSSLTSGGPVVLGSTSSLVVHIGGTASAGTLNSAATTAIAGRMTVVFDEVAGFTPQAGNSWMLVSGPPDAQFPQVVIRGLPSGLQASLEYTPNFVNVKLAVRDGISFADWASLYEFASPADASPGADPDGDGLSNLLEFGFGGHPLRFDAGLGPELVIVSIGAQRHLGLRYWKPAGAQRRLNLTYTTETSPGTTAWNSAGIVVHETLTPDASGRERITVRLTDPLAAPGRRSLRIRMAVTP